MKSSVVFNSIASWVSKLHPQLPLNPKESQRLLTALTTSFRRQLDQSHPQGSNRTDTKQQSSPKAATTNQHTSSFHAADNHLASVLTNPLLSRLSSISTPKLDYVSAQKALLQDPFQDTVALLEKYQDRGAADTKIAALCLETYVTQLNNLTGAERREMLKIRRAGERTLAWLWRSGFHDTTEWVDDPERRLSSVMIPLLLEEGHEEVLWELLRSDLKLGPQEIKKKLPAKLNSAPTHSSVRSVRTFEYRWKLPFVYVIVSSKLRHNKDGSADSAIDAVVRLRNMVKASNLPVAYLRPAILVARRLLRWKEGDPLLANTNPAKYDQLISTLAIRHEREAPLAQYLQLIHPRCPNPEPLLKVLRAAAVDADLDGNDNAWHPGYRVAHASKDLTDGMLSPHHAKMSNGYRFMYLRLFVELKLRQKNQDAKWVREQIKEMWPDYAAYVERDAEALYSRAPPVRAPEETTSTSNATPLRVPMPSFT